MEGKMGKYRKKPVVIEAVQFIHTPTLRTIDFCIDFTGGKAQYCHVTETLAIHTLEGVVTARNGDWVIKGVQGEFYPCKPDIFEETYEPV
jgi:hypothetical protein